MNRLIASLLFFALFVSAVAQDTSKIKWSDRIDFDISAGDFYQSPTGEVSPTLETRQLYLPSHIRDLRQSAYNGYNPKIALDNPLWHNAAYIWLHSRVRIAEGVALSADLIGEHRGFSYGVYTSNNTVVLPQIRLDIERSWQLFGKKSTVTGHLGNLNRHRLYEGLTIYNIDIQGYDLSYQWGKFGVQYVQINDLYNGIGLNLDETWDYIFFLKDLDLGNDWKADVKAGRTQLLAIGRQEDNMAHLSAGFHKGEVRVYAQAGVRPIDDNTVRLGNISDYAFVAGMQHPVETDKMKLNVTLEGRWYGNGFNENYKSLRTSYRTSRDLNDYGRTVGPTLYPLYQYERAFSQWAVFTEYQMAAEQFGDIRSLSVGAATIRAKGQYNFHKEWWVIWDADINLMLAQFQPEFTYAFYTGGLAWEPAPGNQLAIIATNKGMNMDVNYPTFYFYRRPHIGLQLIRKGPFWRNGKH